MKKNIINSVLVVILYMTTTLNVWSTPVPAPSNMPWNPEGGQDEAPGAPIDQIVIWLIATSILLAGFYFLKYRSNYKIKE